MNIEKLLGKLLQEVIGSGGGQLKNYQGSRKNYEKRSGTDSLLGGLTNQLTSGKGLMTAIGLGVGAYEIFRTSKQAPQSGAVAAQFAAAAPPLGSISSMAPPPPPPPPGMQPQNPVQQTSSAAPVRTAAPPVAGFDNQELAHRLIRVMVGAAHADGTLDADEEKIILDRLRAAELSQEEKIFLLEELHHPRSVAELAEGVSDARFAQTMYAVAVSTVEVDTDSERQWLDELGAALGLSQELRRFIEENH